MLSLIRMYHVEGTFQCPKHLPPVPGKEDDILLSQIFPYVKKID